METTITLADFGGIASENELRFANEYYAKRLNETRNSGYKKWLWGFMLRAMEKAQNNRQFPFERSY